MLCNVSLVTQSTWHKIPEDLNHHVTRPLTENNCNIITFRFSVNVQTDRQNMIKEYLGDIGSYSKKV